ncbi:hypothetical protein CTI12_AA256700 [Artemisia annua]|uniref:Oxidative stress 3 n=1 Tax=Artemisia annua TaxID=35608 RepID=A0A2U1NJF0_ARTAN|nr:hypothetical protein CTI12_AA256700 [Artemisia annua]
MQRMSEYKKQAFEGDHGHHAWSFTKKLDQDQESIEEETSTISNCSSSISSCCSFDTTDDASSSSSNSARSSVLDLSDLMAQLPIKRGLSKFYHGKSDSFTNLSRVMSIEDLPKKQKTRKMNSKSYGGGLDSFKSHTLPRSNIAKKHSTFLRQRSFAKSTMLSGQLNNN